MRNHVICMNQVGVPGSPWWIFVWRGLYNNWIDIVVTRAREMDGNEKQVGINLTIASRYKTSQSALKDAQLLAEMRDRGDSFEKISRFIRDGGLNIKALMPF